MITTSIEKLAYDIGFDIGHSSDEVQARLLNGFGEALHDSIIKEYDRDTQMCYIARYLTPKAVAMMKRIVEFFELKQREPEA